MKKVFSIALIAILLMSTIFTFAGCLFKDGSEDEVPGVYGVDKMFYKSYDGKTYNYAGKFEYYLLVLNKDAKTGKVIIKPVDGEEASYDVTYSLEFDSENEKVVKKVNVIGFRLPTYADATGELSFAEPAEVAFVLYPKRRDLKYKDTTPRIEDWKTKFRTNHLEFHKITNKTSKKKIESAKRRQIKFREKRGEKYNDTKE